MKEKTVADSGGLVPGLALLAIIFAVLTVVSFYSMGLQFATTFVFVVVAGVCLIFFLDTVFNQQEITLATDETGFSVLLKMLAWGLGLFISLGFVGASIISYISA